MQVGFIGLGSMGAPMARNLIEAGHVLTVYNRTRSSAEEFEPLGARVASTSGEAAASVMKLAGNFLITALIEGLAESFALVRKYGVEADSFLEVLTGSLFNAPVYKNYGAMIAADRFEPVGFKLPLGLKDNRLLLAAAEERAVPMPLASLVRDRFLAAMATGLGESDWAAMARVSDRNAGLKKEGDE
jgi:3-hydroxyisobutyrate dehydrogenase-like beta-hydroxyacid dehydrogenase